MLRYVESFGEVRRGMVVLKMRGSRHDSAIREYVIDENGMHIGEKLGRIHGLLWGSPSHVDPEMVDRIQSFTEPGSAR